VHQNCANLSIMWAPLLVVKAQSTNLDEAH
jgi:hypothetical protein